MAILLKKKNEVGPKLLEAISTLEPVTGESVQEVQARLGKRIPEQRIPKGTLATRYYCKRNNAIS
jgi:hypothetical protein